MALDTYANLKTAVLQGLARPDDPLVAPAVSDMIRLFEAEARRRLQVGGSEQGTSLSTVAGESELLLPADCGAVRSVDVMSPAGGDRTPLEYLSPSMSAPLLNQAGRPRYFTLFGNSARTGGPGVRLVPAPDGIYTIAVDYLRDLPPLSETSPTNWLLTSSPDLYYFGTLVEAEMYVGHDERVTMWLQRRDLAFASIERADLKARWPGGNLQIRVDFLPRRGGGGSSAIIVIPPGEIMNLNDLDDVDTSGVTAGMGLIYQGPAAASAAWIAGAISGSAPIALDDLTDVNVVGATAGTVLGFTGTSWVPQVIPGAGGVTFPLALPAGGIIDSPSGWIAVAAGGVAPVAPVDVGGRSGANGSDSGFFLRRDLTNATGGGAGTTGHGYTDQSQFQRTGTTAYASFDARVNYAGTTAFDHYVGFQCRTSFSQTGQINSVRMHDTRMEGGAASASALNVLHFMAGDDADYLGTITGTQWGLYVTASTKGPTKWGIQVANNDCRFNESTIWADGTSIWPNGALGASSIYLGTGNLVSGIFRPGLSAIGVQYTSVEKFRVQDAGIRVWDITGADSTTDIRVYKSSDGLTVGNAALTFAAPDSGTAVGGSVLQKAFAVLFGETGVVNSRLLLGVTAAGNPSLGTTLGTAQAATDIGMLFDASGARVDFMSQSTTAFARLSGGGESYINRTVDGPHRLTVTNSDPGTAAFAAIEAGNGSTAADRISMTVTGTGATLTGFLTADTGVLYAGGNLTGGLTLGSNAGTVRINSGGPTNLAATFTANAAPSMVLGNAALVTTATTGFLYICTGPGAPTGVPSAYTGRAPLYYDSTNNQLYIYNAGWKQPKTPAAAAVVTWQ